MCELGPPCWAGLGLPPLDPGQRHLAPWYHFAWNWGWGLQTGPALECKWPGEGLLTLQEEEGRGQLWAGPSFPSAVSSPAACLPTGLLGFPEGRAWAPSSPSLVSVDTGGLANGSKVEVPPSTSPERKGR